MATNLMQLVSVATMQADADSDGICDDVDLRIKNSTVVACATALVRSMNADAKAFLKETATAMATNLMLLVCGGSGEADADNDGICDNVDPCVGELDACGVCNWCDL